MSLTPEQQAQRRVRVTASTLPAFLGYSPYQSPRDEWARHLGKRPNGDNSDTQSGKEFEEGIARATARVLGIPFERLTAGPVHRLATDGVMIHPEASFMSCTPDYLIEHLDTGVQIKKHAPHMVRTYEGRPGDRGDWDNGLVPLAYELQCQIEMLVVGAVTGNPPLWWYLSSYFGGNAPRVYRIRRNERLQASLLTAGEMFWRECIDPDGPMAAPSPERWPWRVKSEAKPAKKPPRLDRDALLGAPLPDLPMSECELPNPFEVKP